MPSAVPSAGLGNEPEREAPTCSDVRPSARGARPAHVLRQQPRAARHRFLTSSAGEIVALMGTKWHGQDDADPIAARARAAAPRRCPARRRCHRRAGAVSHRPSRTRLRPRRARHLPDCCRCAKTCCLAARPGTGGCGWTLDRVLATFPRLAQRLAHRGSQLSGGEQQMLTLGRALMTQSAAAPARRGDRRAGAAGRARHLGHDAVAARLGHGDGNRRQEFRDALASSPIAASSW